GNDRAGMAEAGNRHAPPNSAYRSGGSIGIPRGTNRVTVGDAARTGATERRPITFRAQGRHRKGACDLNKSAAG
ncbi:MAG TPA: hypothetical protein VMR62_03535, partial [Bryobacteraceae bacterium]|nr:hypothetical protein [Bryobacteraceae bacterium]